MSAEYRAQAMHDQAHEGVTIKGCRRCRLRDEPSIEELEDMFGVTRDDWLQWESGIDE